MANSTRVTAPQPKISKVFANISPNRRTSLFLLGAQILAAGVAFLVNIVIAWAMDPVARGILAFVLQITYTLTYVSLLGLERPFMATQKGTFPQLLVSFVRMTLPGWSIALLPIGVGLAGLLLGNPYLGPLGILIGAYLIGNSITQSVRVAYVGSRSWQHFVANAVASQLVLVVGAVALAVAGVDDVVVWLALYALTGAVSSITLFVCLRQGQGFAPLPVDVSKRLRRQGLKLLPASFGNSALLRSDRLLLPILSSPAQLGMYVPVAAIMEIAVWPIQQWVDASLRDWGSAGHTRAGQRKLVLRAVGLVLLTSVALAAVAFVVVAFFLPPSYREALGLIPVLTLGSIVYGWTRIQEGLLVTRGKTGSVSIIETVGLVVSLASYVVLMPLWGAMGAAWGALLGYLACALLGWWISSRGLEQDATAPVGSDGEA